MQRIGLFTTALAAIAVIVTSACGSTTAASSNAPSTAATQAADGSQQVTLVVGSGMDFSPSSISVHAGEPVELTLQNTGDQPHDFTLGSGAEQPVKITTEGGQTASSTFTIDQPGTYSFDCSMPGHALLGMRGTITAQ